MKIGIITYTHGCNFGQRLQNYALQRQLEKLGNTVYTILQTSPYGIKGDLKQYIKSIRNSFFFASKDDMMKRERLFKQFNKKFIHFFSTPLVFYGENSWIANRFDAFIVGSDQIWSPMSAYVGNNAFLRFCHDNQKLTYAPSLSVSEIPSNKIEYYRKSLIPFNYISVREDLGAKLIKEITGKDVEVVIDPTLLLNRSEWDNVRKECTLKPNEKYTLEVFLGKRPENINEVRKVQNNKIVFVDSNTPISPDEFIDLVEGASYVLTDSYHASIFSAIYHVPFYNFSRSEYGQSMNSRFDTLYRILGITSRQWDFLKDKQDDTMDFSIIDKNIENERKKSIDFLKRELKQV